MEINEHNIYMRRCLQLASSANGWVAPNPMVGAVLVHQHRIIGEGYHKRFGEAHAEVNCIASVKSEDLPLIGSATLYVSLEPCAHFGKTPPCVDLIIEKRIPRVVIGSRDPFSEVNGKGIDKLLDAGITVIQNIIVDECMELNKRFFTFHTRNRPYIILKWAQTINGRIASEDHSRLKISNEYTNRLVHKWRGEEMAIMVGTNTALFDDPQLNTRLWPGKDPIRLIPDLHLRLPHHLKIFSDGRASVIFNLHKHDIQEHSLGDTGKSGVHFYQVTEDTNIVHQILIALYQLKIQSVLIEGGAHLLQTFIDEEAWDEARIITNESLFIADGLPAPRLRDGKLSHTESFSHDTIRYYKNNIIY